jgi:hypothetical protein
VVSGSRKRPYDDDNSTSVEILDVYKKKWTKFYSLNKGRHHHLTLTYKVPNAENDDLYLFVIGGVNSTSFGVKEIEKIHFSYLWN